MNCRDIEENTHAFLDGALSDMQAEAIRHHLGACAACRREVELARTLESAVRVVVAEDKPPENLWNRIAGNLADGHGSKRRIRGSVWTGVAAAIALLALATVQSFLAKPVAVVEVPVSEMRTFVESRRPLDVATTDPQQLLAWFDGKVDFRLPPPPSTVKPVRLVGGRLCYFLDRRVASYMYRHGDRYVSLYIFSESGLEIPERVSASLAQGVSASVHRREGFTHVVWVEEGFVYSLVADLSTEEIVDLARGMTAQFKESKHAGGSRMSVQVLG